MSLPISAQDLRRVLSRRRPVCRVAEKRASVALVFAAETSETYLLFIRRAEHPSDPWSGHMALPGGHREAEDENDASTAVRELREEVGLALCPDAHLVGQLDDVQATARGATLDLAVSPFVFLVPCRTALQPSPEVEEVLWTPLGRLLDGSFHTTHEVELAEGRFTLPGWRIGERLVWGLTYRMVDSLLSLLKTG